jgi:hypothetical protein
VPKELISRFVKLCPTCQVRRGGGRASTQESEKSPEDYTHSPETRSPESRRSSLAMTRYLGPSNSPVSMGFSANLQHQNRWMTPLQPEETKYAQSESFANTVLGNYGVQDSRPISSSTTVNGRILDHTSFPSVNTQMTSTGFPSSNVRSTSNWQPSPPGYGVKQEPHYS